MPTIDKSTINELAPTDKVYYVWDDAIPGFGVRVMPSGAMSYTMKLFVNGRQKWMGVGKTDAITATEARKKALKAKQDAADGNDPAAERKALRRAPLMSDLLDDFETKHIAHLSDNTKIAYRHDCKIIRTALGKKLVDSVTKADLEDLLYAQGEMRAKANRIIQVAKTLFEKAIEWGSRTKASPAHRAKKHRDNKRERILTDDEMDRLAATLREYQSISLMVREAIRFMLMTGMRIGEVRDLKWRMLTLDCEDPTATFKFNEHKVGQKSGTKTVPLNDPTITLLNRLPKIAGNPYVFPGVRSKNGSLGNWLSRGWRKIRDRAGLNDGCEEGDELIVAHSLRHTFATWLLAEGLEPSQVQKLTGHVSASSLNRYSHLIVHKARESSNRGIKNIADKF